MELLDGIKKGLAGAWEGFKQTQNIDIDGNELLKQVPSLKQAIPSTEPIKKKDLKETMASAAATKKPEETQQAGVGVPIPSKEQVIQRKDYLSDSEKLLKELEKTYKEPTYAVNYEPFIDKYKKEAEKSENPDVSSYLAEIEGLKIKADDILKQKDNQVDRLERFAVYEQLAQALAQTAAGMYGMKHNVDMSGIKFNPTDWDAKLKNRLSVLDGKLDSYKEGQKTLIGNIKDVKAEAKDRDKARLDLAGEELRVGMKQEEDKAKVMSQEKKDQLDLLTFKLNQLLDAKKEEDRKAIALAKINGKATPESRELAKQQLKQDQTIKQTEALIQGVADGTIDSEKGQAKLLQYVATLPNNISKTVIADFKKIEPASKGLFSSSAGKIPESLKNLSGGQTDGGNVIMIRPDGAEISVPADRVEAAKAKDYKVK